MIVQIPKIINIVDIGVDVVYYMVLVLLKTRKKRRGNRGNK